MEQKQTSSAEPQVIAVCRRIVRDHAAEAFEDQIVDMFSASLIVQIYEALSQRNKARYCARPVADMLHLALKITERMETRR